VDTRQITGLPPQPSTKADKHAGKDMASTLFSWHHCGPQLKKMLDFAKYFVGNNEGNIFSTISWAEEYLVALQELRQISQKIKRVHRCVTRNFQKGPKKAARRLESQTPGN